MSSRQRHIRKIVIVNDSYWKSNPAIISKENPDVKPASLINIGANCYLNSALQGISSCNNFVIDIRKIYNKHGEKLKKLSLFYQLISVLNGEYYGWMDISRNEIFKNWNKSGQQDSCELLLHIINEVYNEIKEYCIEETILQKDDVQSWLKIRLPMRVLIEYSIHCECGSISVNPIQSDLALHVPIPDKNISLQDMVDEFFYESKIDGYDCDNKNCNGRNALTMTKICNPLPRTICIHLQRACMDRKILVKIDKKIEFSKNLIIRSNFFSNIKCSRNSCDSCQQNITNNINIESGVSIGQTNESINNDFTIDPVNPNIDEDISVMSDTDEFKKMFSRNVNQIDSENSTDFSNQIFSSNQDIPLDKCSEIDMIENQRFVSDYSDYSCEKLNITNGNCNTFAEDVTNVRRRKMKSAEIGNVTTKNSGNEIQEIEEISDSCPTLDNGLNFFSENDYENILDEEDVLNDFKIDQNGDTCFVEARDEIFNLTSVIVHYGSINGGHFVCFKCFNDKYFLTNDSLVKEVSDKEVLDSKAYILFYEKP